MFITILVFAGALQAPPEPAVSLAPEPVAVVEQQAGVLDLDQLEDIRGGEGTVIVTEQTLSSVNGSTMQANVIGSGNVHFEGSAFDSFDGIGNFVMNTGHQNTIQTAVSVSVVLTAPIQ